MMNEYVSQNRQLGLFRGDLAVIGSEGRAEALKGSRGIELVNLPLYLLRNKFSFEV